VRGRAAAKVSDSSAGGTVENLVRDALRSLVFILGPHRSGTTLLYEMMAAGGSFNIVTARHVIHFDELRRSTNGRGPDRQRLRERFDRLGISSRQVDRVGATPDTPEEYGFLLDNAGGGVSLTMRNFPLFQRICETVQGNHGLDRPLLLKNPWDFGHGDTIRTLLPDCRFVYIHRNPLHVLSSLYRFVTEAVAHPSAYLSLLSDRYRLFVESEFPLRAARLVCGRGPRWLAKAMIYHTARLASGYLRSISKFPSEARIDIHYETLCSSPNATMSAILAHAGVAGGLCDYQAMIHVNPLRVADEIAAEADLVLTKLTPYAAAVGYDLRRLVAAVT